MIPIAYLCLSKVLDHSNDNKKEETETIEEENKEEKEELDEVE